MSDDLSVVMVARNDTIADLVRQCAEGKLPFSGPDSLYSKVRAMGFNGNSLYEAVVAEEHAMEEERRAAERDGRGSPSSGA